jgi:hypothetical protein
MAPLAITLGGPHQAGPAALLLAAGMPSARGV